MRTQCLLFLLALIAAMSSSLDALARPIAVLTYGELVEKADIVVVARPVRIGDAVFEPLAELSKAHRERLIGVETRFTVLFVFKGKHKEEHLDLLHDRYRVIPGETVLNGPRLISFDPSQSKKIEYLLFLSRRRDGRYECVTGQIDPYLSVRKMENPVPP